MEVREAFSSVVFVGEDLTPSIFKPKRLHEMLGAPDDKQTIKTPVVGQYVFPTTGFRIVITPDRIDIGYSGTDILPNSMQQVADKVAAHLLEFDATLKAIGINVNIAIPRETVGMSGTEFCQQNFLNIGNMQPRIGDAKLLANTATLIVERSGVRYNIGVEPHFASQGEHLFLKINGHQQLESSSQALRAIERYPEVSGYIRKLPANFVGAKQ